MSSYVIDLVPNRYGNQQLDYLAKVEAIVGGTIDKIQNAVISKQCLATLFHEIIFSMGKQRQLIAQQHGTNNADLFGIRRDHEPFKDACTITCLNFHYKEYNDKLLSLFYEKMKHLKRTPIFFNDLETKEVYGPCMNKTSSLELSILTNENQNKWTLTLDEENFKRIGGLCSLSLPNKPFERRDYTLLLTNKEAMKKLKQASFDDYKKIYLTNILVDVKSRFKGIKSDWVFGVMRIEIEGKMIALSRYFFWLNRDFVNDPIEKMKQNSTITLIHQDAFLIEKTLNDIARLFAEIVTLNSEDLNSIKNKSALLQYEFAHACPFARGSAAISEWIEMSIFQYHGYKVSYNPKVSANLEALTTTFPTFIENYDSMISLEKITP